MVVALFVALSPGAPSGEDLPSPTGSVSPSTSSSGTATASPSEGAPVTEIDVTVHGGTVDAPERPSARQGDEVLIVVRGDVSDEVHVHGYDLMKDVQPGQTATFSFPADITGIFEIELESRGEQIGQLRVDP